MRSFTKPRHVLQPKASRTQAERLKPERILQPQVIPRCSVGAGHVFLPVFLGLSLEAIQQAGTAAEAEERLKAFPRTQGAVLRVLRDPAAVRTRPEVLQTAADQRWASIRQSKAFPPLVELRRVCGAGGNEGEASLHPCRAGGGDCQTISAPFPSSPRGTKGLICRKKLMVARSLRWGNSATARGGDGG